MRDFRSSIGFHRSHPVPGSGERQATIGELATIQVSNGPGNASQRKWPFDRVRFVDLANRDTGSYIAEAGRVLHEKIILPLDMLFLGGAIRVHRAGRINACASSCRQQLSW